MDIDNRLDASSSRHQQPEVKRTGVTVGAGKIRTQNIRWPSGRKEQTAGYRSREDENQGERDTNSADE